MKYFAHDIFARQDIEIKKIIHKFGMAGYGIFWALAEILHNNDNKLDLEELEIISSDLKVDFDVIKSIIFDFKIFSCEKNIIKSKRVAKNLKQQKEKSLKAKKSIMQRWKQKAEDTNVLQTYNERNTIKEKKIKESKVNNLLHKLLKDGFEIQEEFIPLIERWLEYKKTKGQSYKNEDSLKEFIKKLIKLSGGSSEVAEKIIGESLANNWSGIFDLKNVVKGNFNKSVQKDDGYSL